MRVILLRDIPRLGSRGDIKNVADGYALHFLIPRSLVEEATPQNLSKQRTVQKVATQHKEKESEAYETLRKALDGKTITIYKPADAKGNLYAGISAKDIVKVLSASKLPTPDNLQENHIIIDAPIKTAGEYQAVIKHSKGNFAFRIRAVSQKKKIPRR